MEPIYLDLFIYLLYLCVNKEIVSNFLSGKNNIPVAQKLSHHVLQSQNLPSAHIGGTDWEQRERENMFFIYWKPQCKVREFKELPFQHRAGPSI